MDQNNKKLMILRMRYKRFAGILAIGIGFTTLAQGQTSVDQALNSCMQRKMAQGAIIGGLVGGLLGALVGNNNNRGKNAALGAGVGAIAGGAIAWQSSWASCLKDLNLATAESIKTDDYKSAAQRYNYQGDGVFLKIEEVNVPSPIVAGQTMKADLKYTLLTPEDLEINVEVNRVIVCGNTQIPVSVERYKVTPGTIFSSGSVPIPELPNNIGQQSCTMSLSVVAGGLMDRWQGNFVLQPSQQ